MEEDRFLENERRQIEQIRQLDMEELQVEIIGDDASLSDEDEGYLLRGHEDGRPYQDFNFDTCLASLHSYLGEVDDTHGRLAFLDGGATLNLPMFYLEGIVLFPEATLPLRVIQSRYKAAVERAMNQVDAPHMIGVIGVHRPENGRLWFGTIGTTAEIRQYKQLDDGSLNIVARGQQRFHLRRRWLDVEGAPCAEVQIIQEDTPLRTPRDAFGQLASVSNLRSRNRTNLALSSDSHANKCVHEDDEIDWECLSDASIQSDNSLMDTRRKQSTVDSPNMYIGFDDSAGSSEDEFINEQKQRPEKSYPGKLGRSHLQHEHEKMNEGGSTCSQSSKESTPIRKPDKGERQERNGCSHESKRAYRAPMSFWPQWVYGMYDSYSLSRRAADMWRQIIGAPNMDDLVNKPDLLSFYIASRLPLSQSTRQELLEIDGVSYRLRREIQLLESFNLVRCKNCLTVIAKRSDMLVMSSDGPLNAYVNPHGFVHEIMTFNNASGLALQGFPVKEHSWFPGYAWTCTNCAACESNMGWLFTATNKKLRPKSFWGIRSSQVADDT